MIILFVQHRQILRRKEVKFETLKLKTLRLLTSDMPQPRRDESRYFIFID